VLEILVFISCAVPHVEACNKSLEAYYYHNKIDKMVNAYVDPIKKEYEYLTPYATAGQILTERRIVVSFTF